MTTPASLIDCAAFAEGLDLYLDGELAPSEAAAVETHAAACPACAAELALARRTLAVLRATPAEPCPDDVFAAVLGRVAALPAAPVKIADRLPALPLRPVRLPRVALAAGVLAAALTAALAWPQLTAPEPSAAEVAQARAEVELALGLVGEASEGAGRFLRDDVLGPHLADLPPVSD